MERLPSSWSQAVLIRKSRRSFHSRRPEDAKLDRLEKLCREFRPFPAARTELVRKSTDAVFRGLVGGYGKITGAAFYLAFIGDSEAPHVEESVGYTGEGAVLEATALGLGTCWVSGFFRPDIVREHLVLAAHEKVYAVSPVGYAEREFTFKDKVYRKLAGSNRRKALAEIAEGILPEPWQAEALAAARNAPSAGNRQPWRFVLAETSMTVRMEGANDNSKYSKRLDCGIAMLHVEVGAQAAGVRGTWTFLPSPEVARFDLRR